MISNNDQWFDHWSPFLETVTDNRWWQSQPSIDNNDTHDGDDDDGNDDDGD